MVHFQVGDTLKLVKRQAAESVAHIQRIFNRTLLKPFNYSFKCLPVIVLLERLNKSAGGVPCLRPSNFAFNRCSCYNAQAGWQVPIWPCLITKKIGLVLAMGSAFSSPLHKSRIKQFPDKINPKFFLFEKQRPAKNGNTHWSSPAVSCIQKEWPCIRKRIIERSL